MRHRARSFPLSRALAFGIWMSTATVCFGLWAGGQHAERSDPQGEQARESTEPQEQAEHAEHAETAPTSRPDRSPERLEIPAIDLSTRVVGLGLEPDRNVEVPADADLAGWFRLGPKPGEIGSAVILGHVDSDAGPAVFERSRTCGRVML